MLKRNVISDVLKEENKAGKPIVMKTSSIEDKPLRRHQLTESVGITLPQNGEGVNLRVKRSQGILKGGIDKVATIRFEPRRCRVIGKTEKRKGSVSGKGGKRTLGEEEGCHQAKEKPCMKIIGYETAISDICPW